MLFRSEFAQASYWLWSAHHHTGFLPRSHCQRHIAIACSRCSTLYRCETGCRLPKRLRLNRSLMFLSGWSRAPQANLDARPQSAMNSASWRATRHQACPPPTGLNRHGSDQATTHRRKQRAVMVSRFQSFYDQAIKMKIQLWR